MANQTNLAPSQSFEHLLVSVLEETSKLLGAYSAAIRRRVAIQIGAGLVALVAIIFSTSHIF
jgi:hypothetical protein